MTDPNQYFYDQQRFAASNPRTYDLSGPGASFNEMEQPQFSTFDYSNAPPQQQPQSYDLGPSQPQQPVYTGSMLTPEYPANAFGEADIADDDFENEPPLLEELGINFDHIFQKTLAVLNPLKELEQDVLQDADVAGPLLFCLTFGGALLLAGKLHFGYIYGIGVLGCLSMYCLLNLMSLTTVSASAVTSTLGYCLLPMVFLSLVAVFISLRGPVGMVLSAVTVLWCSLSASKLFVQTLSMDHQQPLVMYPCALVYAVFALLTVF